MGIIDELHDAQMSDPGAFRPIGGYKDYHGMDDPIGHTIRYGGPIVGPIFTVAHFFAHLVTFPIYAMKENLRNPDSILYQGSHSSTTRTTGGGGRVTWPPQGGLNPPPPAASGIPVYNSSQLGALTSDSPTRTDTSSDQKFLKAAVSFGVASAMWWWLKEEYLFERAQKKEGGYSHSGKRKQKRYYKRR